MNGISATSMRTLRSSPVTVSFDCPGSLLGVNSWRVMIPSIRTVGRPPTVTTTITRVVIGSKKPAGSITASRGERLETAKVSWNPLLSLPFVTCTASRASITGRGAGTGTAGPMSRVRWMASFTRGPRHALGEGDADAAPRGRGQLAGVEGEARVGDAPLGLGVAEGPRP